jgi:ribonuclease Z
MSTSPRRLAVLLGVIVATLSIGALPAQAPRFRVTLLGTGSPPPRMDRFGPATLVEAGTGLFLFDAGRGVLQRLVQAGHQYRDLRALFLTHLHSDHVVGLPDLWLTGWLLSRRDHPLQVFGPAGSSDMASHLAKAFAYDLGIRIEDDGSDPAGGRLDVTEIKEGVLYRQDGVTITAFDVDHRPIAPAFGYRIDYGGRSAVLSGDTRVSENLVKWAKGADLLVHEVAYRTGETQSTSRILAHHTLPAQAGDVFSRVAPGLAVYSHVGVSADISDARLVEMTRATYKGPLVVGADLMSFDIGQTVQVNQPPGR